MHRDLISLITRFAKKYQTLARRCLRKKCLANYRPDSNKIPVWHFSPKALLYHEIGTRHLAVSCNMFLCGVFISGPCFIVANTHHQVPQWVVNHLHSIMPSMTSLLNCRKEVSLTWMIIAWTPYMQGSQLVEQLMRRSLARLTLKPKTYFLPASNCLEKVTFQAYYSLWPQKPLKLKIPTLSGPLFLLWKNKKKNWILS